ncbi:urea ABC transporter permease subunit UrtB [Sedimenticola selenatireducens]|uniref:Urea ABC transporter permease subunit UrtB n=1 Tax=Sedimenticola selenatireducens TaxID=191960 RepID=A0A557S2N1_9GAMM|nr:urea ABC transporter permease subunit UrtB [Sedimenticola selenatireducens]TVO71643.1 urea ABC transporter permease subunit UrtB [Sedimenticola selenatireducens]TVT65557.1 MAG: urea ABC transporter permease subunit UrtB [Sedimenticola selenatireducens]
MAKLITWILLIIGITVVSLNPTYASGHPIADAAELLKSKKFTDKYRAIELLEAEGSEQAEKILIALQESRLYYLKRDKKLIILAPDAEPLTATNALTHEDIGPIKKSAAKKISLNNRMRSQIRNVLAMMDLRNPLADKRLAAVNQMLDNPSAESATLIQTLLIDEQVPEIREAMEIVIALGKLTSGDKNERLTAVAVLDGNIHPAVRNGLRKLQQQTTDKAFAADIKQVLDNIQAKLQLYSLVENIFFGLSLGSVLVLAAIGLAITFGVMGVINMAHGELIMIGAYTTYVMQLLLPNDIGLSLLLSIPAAFVISGLVGIAIERGVIRFLYGRSLETLLATFGISLILQQTVRTIFSPLNRSVETPTWMSGSWEINSALSLTLNRLYIIAFCLLVFGVLYLVLKKSVLGLQVRAVSQNRAMARAMGVRSEWVDAMTFGLGSGIAGIAGVALSQLTNVGPNLGQAYIIDSFMVVVFGGVGNLWGTLVSGMGLGIANKFLEPWSGAVLAKILVLVFIILFIQKRPRGLFPQKGRAAEG